MKHFAVTLLGLASAAMAHPLRRQAPERTFTGAPYPTGAGFDVPSMQNLTPGGEPAPTVPVPTTAAAGAIPTALPSGAPRLPDLASFNIDVYPPRDKIPPTDSPQVKAWLKELEGKTIPDFAPSIDGTCGSDPAAAEAGPEGRCWWSCGQCTRVTDVEGCEDRARWGVTFDDGPSPYTPKLLQYLESVDTKATFYLVGSRVVELPEIVQSQHILGHELAVHTWSHPALTSLSDEEIVAELGWARQAIKDVTGVTPLYFRPPFGDIDDRVRAIGMAMGMTPVMWSRTDLGSLDTFDYNVPGGVDTAEGTISTFRDVLSGAEKTLNTGIVVLEHDLFQETVDLAIGFHLPDALTRAGPVAGGWKLGTVAQCLGYEPAESYLETTKNSTLLAFLGKESNQEADEDNEEDEDAVTTSLDFSSTASTSASRSARPTASSTSSTSSTGETLVIIPRTSSTASRGPAPTAAPEEEDDVKEDVDEEEPVEEEPKDEEEAPEQPVDEIPAGGAPVEESPLGDVQQPGGPQEGSTPPQVNEPAPKDPAPPKEPATLNPGAEFAVDDGSKESSGVQWNTGMTTISVLCAGVVAALL